MAVTATPALPQKPNRGLYQITNANGQTQETVYTGGSNGSKVVALLAVSTDTSSRDVQVSISNGGTAYPIGTIAVPAGAGNASGTVGVNMLNSVNLPGLPIDSDGNPFLFLASASDTLTVSALTTVTSGKLITLVAIGADF